MKLFSISVTLARLSSLLLVLVLLLRRVGLLDGPFNKSPGDQGLTGWFCRRRGCGCNCDCCCGEPDSPSGPGWEEGGGFSEELRGAEVFIGLAMAAIDAGERDRGHCRRMERREDERRFMDRTIRTSMVVKF